MARPCFTPLFSQWTFDDTWSVGPYTDYPVGLTLAQYCELLYNVRLWQVTASTAVQVTRTDFPGITYNDGVDFTAPIPMGRFSARSVGDGACSITDAWKTYREAGSAASYGASAASYGATTHDVSLGYFGPGSTTINATTVGFPAAVNYTDIELRALFSLSGFVRGAQIFIRSPGIVSGGLYYPFIRAVVDLNHTSFLSKYPDFIPGGTFTIRLRSGDLVIPMALSIPDYCTLDSQSCDITVEAVKYWPYKDGAGMALYNETTGARV